MRPTVNYLGFYIGFSINKPIQYKIAAIFKKTASNAKIQLMSFIGSLNFYSSFIDKLHVNMKALYGLLQDIVFFPYIELWLRCCFIAIKHL